MGRGTLAARDWQTAEQLWPATERYGNWKVRVLPDGTRSLVDRRTASAVMSSGERERFAFREYFERASGRVLCLGLGMGWTTAPLLHCTSVESLDVVELDPELVEWVGPKLNALDQRGILRLHVGDAWQCSAEEQKWDTIFLNVWHERGLTGLSELVQRWTPSLAPGGWLGHWLCE